MERVEEIGRKGKGSTALRVCVRAWPAARCVSRDALSLVRFYISVFPFPLSRSPVARLTLLVSLSSSVSFPPSTRTRVPLDARSLLSYSLSFSFALALPPNVRLLARSLAHLHVEAVPPVRRALLPSLRPSSLLGEYLTSELQLSVLQRFSTASVLTRTEGQTGLCSRQLKLDYI